MSLLASTLQYETQPGGRLQDNAFAKALLPLMNRFSVRLTDVADEDNEKRIAGEVRTAVRGIANHTFENLPEPDYSIQPHDYRIRRIHVKGLRTFPANDNRYYSLSMTRSPGDCCSSVFLGTNGIGKTSFYCGLEWASLGYSDSANHRGYTKGGQPEFLQNLRSNQEDVSILLETMEGNRTCDITMPVTPIAYPAFFCMERDVEILSKEVSETYIATQLGILDFKVFVQTIDKMVKEYEEGMEELRLLRKKLNEQETALWLMDKVNSMATDDRKAFAIYLRDGDEFLNNPDASNRDKAKFVQSHIVNLQRFVKALLPVSEMAENPTVKEVYNILPQYCEYLVNSPLVDISSLGEIERDQYVHRLAGTYRELYKQFAKWGGIKNGKITILRILQNEEAKLKKAIRGTHKSIGNVENSYPASRLPDDDIEALKEIRDVIRKEYGVLLLELKSKADTVFRHLFMDFFLPDLKKVQLEVDTELKVVVTACDPARHPDDDLGMTTTPRHFLNNFRFKLFCVALKVALAFTCSAMTGITFPIVLDDVFDSSDFSNRLLIREFIKHLFEAHKTVLSDACPLQVIFFTQDDVIGEAVVQGIREYNPENGVKYSRLFSFVELSEKEYVSLDVKRLFQLSGQDKVVTGYVEDGIL